MNLIENVELDNIVSAKSQIQILSQIKSTTELKNRISTTKIYSMSGEFLRYTVYKYGKTFTEGVVEEYAPNGEVLTINEIKDGVPSTRSPIIINNMEKVEKIEVLSLGKIVKIGEPIMKVTLK